MGITEKNFLTYDLEKDTENLDYFLLERGEVYVFSELEEYTYAIITLLIKKYPDRPIIVLDERISYFPQLMASVIYMDPANIDYEEAYGLFGKKQYLWVISDGLNYNGFPWGCFINIYNSINVMVSLFWCFKRQCFGEKNKESIIFVLDFSNESAGLVDYIKLVCKYYYFIKRYQWKFVVDFSHQPNQYLTGETENMWDYFFESVSDISLEEAYESFSVIRYSDIEVKMGGKHIYPWSFPNIREVCLNEEKIIKLIKFNEDTRIIIEQLTPKKLKEDNYVLGIILRGTDYRLEANRIKKRGIKSAGLAKMIAKCKFIMKLYGYQYIFLATEDMEYFERMKEEFGDKCLFIPQKRGYWDYEVEYKSCKEVLDIRDGKEFGRKYLAVIQSLANCRSLIANMDCGATWLAKYLNDSQYEYFEIVEP